MAHDQGHLISFTGYAMNASASLYKGLQFELLLLFSSFLLSLVSSNRTVSNCSSSPDSNLVTVSSVGRDTLAALKRDILIHALRGGDCNGHFLLLKYALSVRNVGCISW